MKNKVTDPIDYIYNFTKSNIQGPRNLPDTMIKCSDGTFEEVLKRTGGPIYEYQVGVLWPHRVFKKEEEQEEDSFNKGDGDDDSDIEEESILNQKIKNKIDLFERGHKYEVIKLDDSFPKYLLRNIEKFKNFIEN